MSHAAADNLPPIHPGEMLRDDLEALGLSARRLAEHIGVPPNAITEILNGQRRITARMALRLGRAFGTDPRYWTNLRSLYETKMAHAELGDTINANEPLPHVGKACVSVEKKGMGEMNEPTPLAGLDV